MSALTAADTLSNSILQTIWTYKRLPRYEGCSNMNASGFITFFTYKLRHNGKRFYKGQYVTFKVAPDLKEKYSILIELYPFE